MRLKKNESLSGNLMTRAGNHSKHLKSYLSLIYNENSQNFLVSNSDGMCIRGTYERNILH